MRNLGSRQAAHQRLEPNANEIIADGGRVDRRWAEAVEMGQKNRRTAALVQDWCAHARIENHGGVGLIQMQTGLPIGLLAMACDYAASGNTMAAGDLADAALDFHDRNCIACPHRKPVRLPNLSELVAERDAAFRAHEVKVAAQRLVQADALRKRRGVRDALRSKLPPPSQSLVDHLDALDTGSESAAGEELEAAAGLAPEAFTSDLVEYLFGLIDGNERWAMETALVVLDKIGAASDQLANGALRSLGLYGGIKSAEVLLRHLDRARSDLVGRAVPMLIHHAEPADLPFIEREGNANPRFLLAVHKAFPAEVERVVDDLLESKDSGRESDGARAVCVLGASDGAVALKFARSVISKLARTNWEGDSDSQLSAVRGVLLRAAALAFRFDPVATEALIESFRMGASPNGHKELLNIYQWVLRRGLDEKNAPFEVSERAAFDRMIALASNPPNKEAESELGSFFAHAGYRFKELAAEKIDVLLGAAALLADMLDRLDAQYKATPPAGFLGQLERNSRRSGLASLQGNLTELAAEAAADDAQRTRKFLSFLGSIPSERTELRHALIDHLDKLVTSPETLSEVLPYLYSALVGAQALERGAAAKTIGEILPNLLDDAPPLLLEAFVALLSDHFQFPVAQVVEALERVKLPDEMKANVRGRLWMIILAYAQTASQQAFLVQAIDTFARGFLSDDQRAGKAGEALIKILEGHEVVHYYRELRHLAYLFKRLPAFVRLVVKALTEPNYRHLDGTVELLRDLPAATVVANAAALEALVSALSLEREEWRIGQVLIEAFTRSGLWEEALRAIDAMLAKVDDVPRNRRRRLHLATVRAAVEVERAAAQGKIDEIAGLAKSWREVSKREREEANRGD